MMYNNNNALPEEYKRAAPPDNAAGYTPVPAPQYNTAWATPVSTPVSPQINPSPPWQYASVQQKPENAFKPEMTDFIFALIAFVLGYLFSRWVFFSWRGWGVAVFTLTYLLTVTAYLIKKGVFVSNIATWFWLFITLATGAVYAMWENAGFVAIRALLLVCAAVYYIIMASGRAIMGKTGNYILIDGFNAVIILPFRNFINQYVSFSVLGRGKKRGKILPAVLGLALAIILAAILVPMLRRADSGGFGIVLDFLTDTFSFINVENIMYALLAIPVAAYLYGLVSGTAHNKGTDIIKQESAGKTVAALRVIHSSTVSIVLGVVCAIYLVFILSQAPYFFLAFTGRRPAGWLIFSEYARQGFFELCSIATINLALLTAGNLTCKKRRAESGALKAFNIALAIITLVLIATAFSKMALYIGAYGLTMPRLLPCVFMVFLALVFIALIALQKWDFSIIRFAIVTGAVMVYLLCLVNPDALVVRYNTDRYLGGTLPQYDTEILYRAGSAGVIPAIEVYETTGDDTVKYQIIQYLRDQSGAGGSGFEMSFESWQARQSLVRFSDSP